jgi:hypothetical protein
LLLVAVVVLPVVPAKRLITTDPPERKTNQPVFGRAGSRFAGFLARV